MAAKIVRCGEEAGAALARGVDLAADLVATTLGPAGRAVVVGRPFAVPLLLRDGYGVVRQLEPDDPGTRMGVEAMRELAWRTGDAVGDGTSTAVVLARALLRESGRALAAGHAPTRLREAMDRHAGRVARALDGLAVPAGTRADRLLGVATQAAGGDAGVGTLVAEAHERAGPDGLVLVEEGRGGEDGLDLAPGLHFERGWLSPHFVDDPREQSVEIDDPLIVLHQEAVTRLGPIVRVMEMMAKAERGLLVIADDVGGDALATLVANKRQAGLRVAAVKAPEVGLWRERALEDIAVATGGTVIGPRTGTRLEDLRPGMVGRARRVRVTRTRTTITGAAGDAAAVALRAREIRGEIARERHLDYDREQHRKRLARLGTGIATLRPGGATASAIADRHRRAVAASAALRAAREGGLLPGGSAVLIRAGLEAEAAAPADPLERAVGRMFAAALQAPLRAIVDNAGQDGRAAAYRLARGGGAGLCYDVAAHGLVAEDGLWDALPVVRAAVLNASSTAARLLGVAVAITPATV